jgi:hypothetical protein
MLLSCGEHVRISVVFELPPKESWIMRVSFESRYGIWGIFYDKLFITFAKHVKDKFIFFACYKVLPYAPVLETFSEPAKSTINKLLTLACSVSEFN